MWISFIRDDVDTVHTHPQEIHFSDKKKEKRNCSNCRFVRTLAKLLAQKLTMEISKLRKECLIFKIIA